MQYHVRLAESKLLQYHHWFKAVMVLGARQTGKTTLLRQTFPGLPLITFDPVQDLYGARQSPDLFLESFPPPIILDEVQNVPELFPALKRHIDEQDAPGQYFLTGSQNPALLRQIAESLAGRIGILTLDTMGVQEMSGRGAETPWLAVWLADRGAPNSEKYTVLTGGVSGLLRAIWRGGMPGLLELPDAAVSAFLNAYLHTYVERDIRVAGDIRDVASFGQFVALSAALTAQEININQFGREIGVTPATVRKWLEVLRTTYQWNESPAWSGNSIKRLSGKSKGFFADTGLACLLQRISSIEALSVSPLKGALFETFVVNGLRQQFTALELAPGLYHWRTSGGAEVDAVLDWNGERYLVEAKCKTELNGHDLRGIRAFRDTYGKNTPAIIVYAGTVCRRLDEWTMALPWNAGIRDQVSGIR